MSYLSSIQAARFDLALPRIITRNEYVPPTGTINCATVCCSDPPLTSPPPAGTCVEFTNA